jgi:hypothetical protein
MITIRKILATICAILFVCTAIVSLFLFNFSRRAFTAETYERVLANEGFYDRLPGVLAQATTSGSVDKSRLPFFLSGMSPQAWEAFFRTLLPREALKAMGDEALDSVFAYLNLQSDSAQVSLLPLKRSMTGDAGVSAVYTLLDGQPDCTLVQAAQMTINLLGAEDIQYCKPPEGLHPLLTPVIEAQMEVTAFLLPDRITFANAAGVAPEDDPRTRLKNVRLLMSLSPVIPLGFLLLLTILAVSSLRSWLDWWGIPFLTTGLISAIVSLSGAPLIGGLLKRLIAQRAADYLPQVLSDYASDLASAMVRAVLQPTLWQGIILAMIGTVMVFLSVYLARRSVAKNPDPADAKTIL